MHILSMNKGLDIESKGWADREDVFTVYLLQNCSLSRIVEATFGRQRRPIE